MTHFDRRLTWDETWMAVAHVVALRSRCVRDQVGAVIVGPTNRIVATGYNGPAANDVLVHLHDRCDRFCQRGRVGPTDETVLSYTDCASNHAEANGLVVADRSQYEGGTIYISSDVCLQCSKLIANSGLKRVVTPLVHHEHRHPHEVNQYLLRCGIQVSRQPFTLGVML